MLVAATPCSSRSSGCVGRPYIASTARIPRLLCARGDVVPVQNEDHTQVWLHSSGSILTSTAESE